MRKSLIEKMKEIEKKKVEIEDKIEELRKVMGRIYYLKG